KQFLGPNARPELASLLRRQADVVQSALNPYRRDIDRHLRQLLLDQGSELRVPYVVIGLHAKHVGRALVPGAAGSFGAVFQVAILGDELQLLSGELGTRLASPGER